MSVNADWRTYATLGSLVLFAFLAILALVSWLIGNPFAIRGLKSLTWGVVVFFLAFVLQNVAALLAAYLLSQQHLLPGAARWIDEAATAVVFALTSVFLAFAAFWERFHRQP
jgi:hypothetical protein